MVTSKWVEAEVVIVVPDAIVEVLDLNGTGDHFHVRVIAASFDGSAAITTTEANT